MKVITYINERLDSILARPKMWGGAEAVELQVLLLLEFIACDTVPEPHEWVMYRYRRFVRTVTESSAPWLLSAVHAPKVEDLVVHLAAFRALVNRELASNAGVEPRTVP